MSLLLVLGLFGGLEFLAQDMPGLSVGARDFLTGVAPVNTQIADFDGDGSADILLPSVVWLQRDGGFPDTARVPLPDRGADTAYFTDGDALFRFTRQHLSRYQLDDRTWRLQWTAPLPQGMSLPQPPLPILHDLNDDGVKELLLPEEGELLVYHLRPALLAAGSLQIYPQTRPQLPPAHDLWSEDINPRLSAAVLHRQFDVRLRKAALTTIERLGSGAHQTEFQIVHYAVQGGPDTPFAAVKQDRQLVPPLWDGMEACTLNADDILDFAGLRTLDERGAPISVPITEAVLSTDGGHTVQRLRNKAPRTQVALADFDGDGDRDLISETSDLFDGPPKEVLTKLSSQSRVMQTFWANVQQAGGAFALEPRRITSVRIDMQRAALRAGPRWDAYRAGTLTSGTADLNGDGRADVVVWETPAHIAVYLNKEGLFRNTPDAAIATASGTSMNLADVDCDGLADIVVLDATSDTSGEVPRVFFTRWTP